MAAKSSDDDATSIDLFVFKFAHCILFFFFLVALRDGTKLDVDEDALPSGDEGAHYPGVSSQKQQYVSIKASSNISKRVQNTKY